MKQCKRAICVMLTLAMLAAFWPAAFRITARAAVVESGVCNEGVNYTLTDDGVLTFSGEGTVLGVEDEDLIWSEEDWLGTAEPDYWGSEHWDRIDNLRGLFHAVVIEAPIETIGYFSFQNFTNLTSITFPDTLRTISPYAFRGCTGLTEVVTQAPLTLIGKQAFWGCSNLTLVELPNSREGIGAEAFGKCPNLTSMHLPISGLFGRIFERLDYYNDKSNDMIEGDTLETIEVDNIEYDTGHLIHRPGYVSQYGGGIYSYEVFVGDCTYLIPASLTDVTISFGITSISNGAFKGCSNLVDLTIPGSVTTFGEAAFEGCDNLTLHIRIGSNAAAFASRNDLEYDYVPTSVKDLSIRVAGDGQVRLDWSSSPIATQYNIYKSENGGAFRYVGTDYDPPCTETGLVAGSTYAFKVIAVQKQSGATAVAGDSNIVSVKAVAAPAVPTGVTVKATAGNTLAVTYNTSAGATQYNIYRYNGVKKEYVYKGTSYTTTYLDKTVVGGTTYYYKVVAVTKDAGFTFVSAQSAAANAKAVAAPAVPTGVTVKATADQVLSVTYNAVKDATQYNIYRYNGAKKEYVYKGTSYTTTYLDKTVSAGTTYYYKVVAVTKTDDLTLVSDKSAAASAKAVTTPAVPTTVTAVAGSGKITVLWTASSGATQYNVYRYNGEKKQYIYKGTSYGTSYVDASVTAGTTYYYKIVAVTKTPDVTLVSAKSEGASAKAK